MQAIGRACEVVHDYLLHVSDHQQLIYTRREMKVGRMNGSMVAPSSSCRSTQFVAIFVVELVEARLSWRRGTLCSVEYWAFHPLLVSVLY